MACTLLIGLAADWLQEVVGGWRYAPGELARMAGLLHATRHTITSVLAMSKKIGRMYITT